MDRHALNLTTDYESDAALEQAKKFDSFPRIAEAAYRADAGGECLMLRLSNGRRMLIPKEMLGELRNATHAQSQDLKVVMQGLAVWWPQIDDGLYLPDFLEHRWGKEYPQAAA